MRKTYFVDVNRIDTKLYYLEDKQAKQSFFIYNKEKLDAIYNSCVYSFSEERLIITPDEMIYLPTHYSYFEKELFICGTKFGFLDRIGNYAKFIVELIDDNDYDLIFLFSDYIMANNKYGSGIMDSSISMKSVVEKMDKYLKQSFKKVNLVNAFISNFIRFFTILNMSIYGKNYMLIDDTKYLAVPLATDFKKMDFKKRNTQREIYYINKMISDSEFINLSEDESKKLFSYAYDICANKVVDYTNFPLRDYNYKINCQSAKEKIEQGEKDFSKYIKTLNKNTPVIVYHSISHKEILDYTNKSLNSHFKDYKLQKFDEYFLAYFLKYAMFLAKLSTNNLAKEQINGMFKKQPIKIFSDQKNIYLYLQMFADVNSETYKELSEISYPL